MRDLFPGWSPPDERTLSRYWDEASFALDSSVLLDLYRFSEETRSELLKALRSLDDRLWIPHQVADEFHRNRFNVLLEQRNAEARLLSKLDSIRQGLDDELSEALKSAGRRDPAPLQDVIDPAFADLKEKLLDLEKRHTKGLGNSIRDDPVYEAILTICEGKVGSPFDDARYTEILEDGEKRLESETPPGYLDSDKQGN